MYNIERIRNDFPALHKSVFFGSAGVGPLPRTAMVAMQRYSKELRVDFAEAAWKDDPASEVRSLAAQLINADSEEIVVTSSTSEGINILAGAVPWRKRDNIVINDLEYPANVFPWLYQGHRHGVEVRIVRSKDGRLPLAEMIAAIDRRTRVLAVSHVEFAHGFRNDITALAAAVHKMGGVICVDAIQSVGVLPIDVRETDIDALATGGYKWLCGPLGSGFAYVRRELAEKLNPATIDFCNVAADAQKKVWDALVSGHNYDMSKPPLPPNAWRFQSEGGSPIALKGFAASLEYVLELGVATIEERIGELVDYLIERLAASGIEILSSIEPDERSGIITVKVPRDIAQAEEANALEKRLEKAKIIAHVRGGGLRLAVHFFNTEEEIDHVINFIKKL